MRIGLAKKLNAVTYCDRFARIHIQPLVCDTFLIGFSLTRILGIEKPVMAISPAGINTQANQRVLVLVEIVETYLGPALFCAVGPTIDAYVAPVRAPALRVVIICIIPYGRIMRQAPEGSIRPAGARILEYDLSHLSMCIQASNGQYDG